MHKILLTLFFLLTLSLFKTEAFAQEACVEMVCPEGAVKISGTQCARGGGAGARISPTTPMCAAGKVPSNPNDVSSCICNAPAARAETPTPTPCTDGTCTSAKGVRCGVNAGEINQEGGTGVMTAIGCIPSEPKALVEGLLRYGTLAAGGIAFLLMLLGALHMITAEGNPESIKHGQERFYSAIIGLLLIIFSVLLMQVIGVDILGFRALQPNTTSIERPGGER